MLTIVSQNSLVEMEKLLHTKMYENDSSLIVNMKVSVKKISICLT
jgi:hypothetical protein